MIAPDLLYQRLRAHYGPQDDWWPGQSAFEIMLGAILVQRTRWHNAEQALARLRAERALTPAALVAWEPARLSAAIRPAGFAATKARRLQALAQWLLDQGGTAALADRPTPALRAALLARPGIGEETADAMLLYAFRRPVVVIDAYARRILGRLGHPQANARYGVLQQALVAALMPGSAAAAGAQRRLADLHALIVTHAQRHCRVGPRCSGCPLQAGCVHAGGQAELTDRAVGARAGGVPALPG
ncbi:MAG: endonuclease [Pseudomonadota bacterium]|nr:endonuclease [Pseudomonadota bacterium]